MSEKKQENEKIKIINVTEVPLDAADHGDRSWIAGDSDYRKSAHKPPRRHLSPRVLILAALMAAAVFTGAAIYHFTAKSSSAASDEASSLSESSSDSKTESDVSDTESADLSSASSEAAQPEKEDSFPAYLLPPDGYDYSAPAPAYPEQTDEWFSDAVFVGNSRTQGLLLYTGLKAQALADVGLTVETVSTAESFSDPDGGEEKVTAVQALERMDFHKVYLMFGINELGWQNKDVFFSKYVSLIEEIRASHPQAQIYVQSILPVCESKIKDKDYLTNARIDSFNEQLQQMAESQKVFYVDTASAVAAEDGSLPEDASNDGIHLKQDGCQKWEHYLLNHCVTSDLSPSASESVGSSDGYAPISRPNVSNAG